MRVSHETIYRSLFIQARGVLKKELLGHLRSSCRIRRSQHFRTRGQSRGQIVDAISIRERPAEIQDQAIPGHWEGDLITGAKNSRMATLVERHSRFTTLVKVPSKDTAAVVTALSRHVRKLPASLRRSLTWDRGLEMAKHQTFTVATNVKVYFCDPHSPWQRGTNADAEAELQIRLHQTDGRLLRAIGEVLARVRHGTYGVCYVCKQPISKARLEAVPWTRHCRGYKEREHPAA